MIMNASSQSFPAHPTGKGKSDNVPKTQTTTQGAQEASCSNQKTPKGKAACPKNTQAARGDLLLPKDHLPQWQRQAGTLWLVRPWPRVQQAHRIIENKKITTPEKRLAMHAEMLCSRVEPPKHMSFT